MSKSKFIKLLTSAYVHGVPRRPDEGVLHLDEAEADRLIKIEAAEDVSKDFSADDHKDVPVQHLTAQATGNPDLPSVEHQSNIAPAVAEATAPPARPDTPARSRSHTSTT